MWGPENDNGTGAVIDPYYDQLIFDMRGLQTTVHFLAESAEGTGLFSRQFGPTNAKTASLIASPDPAERLRVTWAMFKAARKSAIDQGYTVIV